MSKSKILIIGVGGYIGSALYNYLINKGYEVYGSVNKTPHSPNDEYHNIFPLNILNYESVEELIKKVSPGIIIHTAGLNSLVECEKNTDLAQKINVEGTRNIINSIKIVNLNIKLVFISSDYVFDGITGDYKENDNVNPQTYYGKTKAAAEKEIINNLNNFIICRTANVYGHGGNFFRFVYDSLVKSNPIEVYNDTIYSPTYIYFLLDSLVRLFQQNFNGIIHITGKEKTTRYKFALSMAKLLNVNPSIIKPVSQPREGNIAKNSSLNSDFSQSLLKNYNPSIEKSLMYCLNYLTYPYFDYQDDRGEIIGIFQGSHWEEINYIYSKKGTIRGNHYHKATFEGFYIIDGIINVSLKDLKSGKIIKFKVEKGDFFTISPCFLHEFEIIIDSSWINMLSKPLNGDEMDIYRI